MQINFTGQAVNKLSAIDSFFASLERSSAGAAPAMATALARIRRGGCVLRTVGASGCKPAEERQRLK